METGVSAVVAGRVSHRCVVHVFVLGGPAGTSEKWVRDSLPVVHDAVFAAFVLSRGVELHMLRREILREEWGEGGPLWREREGGDENEKEKGSRPSFRFIP